MENEEIRRRLLNVTALAAGYCGVVETAAEYEKRGFIAEMLRYLPKLYLEFFDLVPGHEDAGDEDEEGMAPDEMSTISLEEDFHPYYADYVDEDYYENVRRHIGNLLGPDDTFLETFEEDMKYSDTPIAASVSECLADIFQPLYNFISVVKETEGDELEGAYKVCHESFVEYWSQTLCNVLRALNNLYYKNSD